MLDLQTLSLKIAEKLREVATRQDNVPFDKGDLRKAHVVEPHGTEEALLAANTPYARAVHDGRPRIVIKPKRGKALKFKAGGENRFARSVTQPARKGNPWLARAVETMEQEGVGFLSDDIGEAAASDLSEALRASGLEMRRKP